MPNEDAIDPTASHSILDGIDTKEPMTEARLIELEGWVNNDIHAFTMRECVREIRRSREENGRLKDDKAMLNTCIDGMREAAEKQTNKWAEQVDIIQRQAAVLEEIEDHAIYLAGDDPIRKALSKLDKS